MGRQITLCNAMSTSITEQFSGYYENMQMFLTLTLDTGGIVQENFVEEMVYDLVCIK